MGRILNGKYVPRQNPILYGDAFDIFKIISMLFDQTEAARCNAFCKLVLHLCFSRCTKTTNYNYELHYSIIIKIHVIVPPHYQGPPFSCPYPNIWARCSMSSVSIQTYHTSSLHSHPSLAYPPPSPSKSLRPPLSLKV